MHKVYKYCSNYTIEDLYDHCLSIRKLPDGNLTQFERIQDPFNLHRRIGNINSKKYEKFNSEANTATNIC